MAENEKRLHRRGNSTLQDVARKAGVASSTASYVLNNKPKSIGPAARERVWAAARDLGYRPNMAARSLVTRRTNIIALWMPDIASAFSARIIAQIQRQARQAGYDLLISEIHVSEQAGGAEPPAISVKLPLWNVDGIIAFLGSSCRNMPLEALPTRPMPTVSMGAYPMEGIDFVGVELFTAAQAAVQRLVELRRRRIAYLVPVTSDFRGDERHEAYTQTISRAGLEPVFIWTKKNTRAESLQAMLDYLQQNGPVDALFCYNDEVAIGAYRALRSAGLRVPEDTALIGCDGIEDIEYLDCPLSTVVVPLEEMCATAWKFLEQRLQDPSALPQKIVFTGRLELRDSA